MSDKNLDQTFLSGSNSVFINDLLNKWENDPKSVPEEWSNFFKEIGSEIADKGPSWAKENNRVIGCLLYTSPSPRDRSSSRMPSSA